MTAKFDATVQAQIDQIGDLFGKLSEPATEFVIDQILAGCLRAAAQHNDLARAVGAGIAADGVVVFYVKAGRWHLESGHTPKAAADVQGLLEAVGVAIKVAASAGPLGSQSIH